MCLRPSFSIMIAQSVFDLWNILAMMFKWCVISGHIILFGRSIDSSGFLRAPLRIMTGRARKMGRNVSFTVKPLQV